jgi:hypothetical protein
MSKIEQKNHLIAEFLELTPCNECNNKNGQYYYSSWYGEPTQSELHYFKVDEMKYHWHWHWLMNVVGRIETTWHDYHGYFAVYISSNSCTIQGTKFRPDKSVVKPVYYNQVVLKDKLESTYIAVINFITWYLKTIKTDEQLNKG